MPAIQRGRVDAALFLLQTRALRQQPPEQPRAHQTLHQAALTGVQLGQDGRVGANLGVQAALGVGDQDLHAALELRERLLQTRLELIEALPGLCRDRGGFRLPREQLRQGGAVAERVDLVEHVQARDVMRTEQLEDLLDGADLLDGLRRRSVRDHEQQIRVQGLFERRVKARDELVREVANEADRVGDQHGAPAAQPPGSGAGVERREQAVLGGDAGVRQAVHQRGLAGVGVTDQSDRELIRTRADLAGLARLDALDLAVDLRDAAAQLAAVEIDLLLPRAAAMADAAALSLEVGPHALQSGQLVLQPGQLHLQLGLGRPGVGAEDQQDQLAAIDDRDLDHLLDGAALGRAERIIADDHVGLGRRHQLGQLLELAAAQVSVGIRAAPVLRHAAADFEVSRVREQLELGEHLGRGALVAVLGEAEQDRLRGRERGRVGTVVLVVRRHAVA